MNIRNLRFLAALGLATGVLMFFAQWMESAIAANIISLDFFLAGIVLLAFFAGILVRRKPSGREPFQPGINTLTIRESEILFRIYCGKTNKEIAVEYFIEISTVKTHVHNIYSKLKVANRKEAREAYKKCLLEPASILSTS